MRPRHPEVPNLMGEVVLNPALVLMRGILVLRAMA